jgi:hypothetical protein
MIIKFRLLTTLIAFVAATAFAQNKGPTKAMVPGVLVSSDPSKPPPFIEVPGDPRPADQPVDKATLALDPVLTGRVQNAHAQWAKAGDGKEFSPSLSFVGGRPIVMVMAESDENPGMQNRRLKAMVEACEFLVDDSAFESAVLCVSTRDAKNPKVMTTQNTEVHRSAFQAAAKSAGKSNNLPAALTNVHASDVAVKAIAAALGLN